MNQKYKEFLYQLGNFGIKLGLENIRLILSKLGNPQKHPKIIHFAGTNGKGSTLITLEKLLLESGVSVGSTVSPHLVNFNERFRINGKPVDDKNLEEAFLKVCEVCNINPADSIPSDTSNWEIRPTFFEINIAIAFYLFQKLKLDYILLETGMGGRLDATNVISNPLATVITNISLDHTGFLGNSLEEIANEKLGIVKQGSPLFAARQNSEVKEQIKKYCAKLNVPVFSCDDDFGFFSKNRETDNSYFTKTPKNKIAISLKSPALKGDYQWDNTATSLAVYFNIIPQKQALSEEKIQTTLNKVKWPGRLQFIDPDQKILIDGAHNPSALEELKKYLEQEQADKKILLALSWKEDKDVISTFADFKSLNIEFQPLETQLTQLTGASEVFFSLTDNNLKVKAPVELANFVNQLENLTKEYDLILVTGSLYLIGDFLALWQK